MVVFIVIRIQKEERIPMNINEECLLKYLQNPDELIALTDLLLDFNQLCLNKQ